MSQSARRTGVFGGTFDPIHFGHLLVAEQARDQLRLDRVIFVPAAIPPHKRSAAISAGPIRVAMLERAGCGLAPFEISQIELQRAGVSFTVDTLRQLRAESPADEFFLLVGRDNLIDLPNWREPAEIAKLATIAYAERLDPHENSPQSTLGSDQTIPPAGFRVERIHMPSVEISGRDIRQRVAAKRSIRYFLPDSVVDFIQQNQLYAATSSPK